jgi:hypothetical protein
VVLVASYEDDAGETQYDRTCEAAFPVTYSSSNAFEDQLNAKLGYPDCTGDCNFYSSDDYYGYENYQDEDNPRYVAATASPGIAGT